jgi:hypothetical protein
MSDMIYSEDATQMSVRKNAGYSYAYVAQIDGFFLK